MNYIILYNLYEPLIIELYFDMINISKIRLNFEKLIYMCKIPNVSTINVPTNLRDFLYFYIIFQIRVGTFIVIK